MPMFTHDQLYNNSGVKRTKSLFADFGTLPDNILTLTDKTKGYPDLRSLYVKFCVDDPSEATFAEEVFGDVIFWANLRESPFLEKSLPEWQYEADVKRKSKAFKHIMKEIEDDGRNGYQAAKFLIDEPWKPKTKASKSASSNSTREAAPAHVVDLAKHIREQRSG